MHWCIWIFNSRVHFQIRDFVKDVQEELLKPGFNSFGLGDCKAPKVLGDIVESIAGAIFLDNGYDTAVVWRVIISLQLLFPLAKRIGKCRWGVWICALLYGKFMTASIVYIGLPTFVASNGYS